LLKNDWKTIFSEYQKSRKSNTDAIAELSTNKWNSVEVENIILKLLKQVN